MFPFDEDKEGRVGNQNIVAKPLTFAPYFYGISPNHTEPSGRSSHAKAPSFLTSNTSKNSNSPLVIGNSRTVNCSQILVRGSCCCHAHPKSLVTGLLEHENILDIVVAFSHFHVFRQTRASSLVHGAIHRFFEISEQTAASSTIDRPLLFDLSSTRFRIPPSPQIYCLVDLGRETEPPSGRTAQSHEFKDALKAKSKSPYGEVRQRKLSTQSISGICVKSSRNAKRHLGLRVNVGSARFAA
ncbi:hypothetical protein IAQ61_008697, partial [Plenodomus lingam]|uniref:uncharacterized protein n=1 Tax=Leptosphaeria maculans TaxID=5022 RepID=UPI003319D3DA